MSVLADIYIAREDEAIIYDSIPDKFVERSEYKSITPLELSSLWAIMRNVEWDASLMDEFSCLLERDGGQRLIHRLPSQMIADLSRLSPEQIVAVSTRWAATEELDWPPEEALPVIEDLVQLSRRAFESGRSVYLWNCV